MMHMKTQAYDIFRGRRDYGLAREWAANYASANEDPLYFDYKQLAKGLELKNDTPVFSQHIVMCVKGKPKEKILVLTQNNVHVFDIKKPKSPNAKKPNYALMSNVKGITVTDTGAYQGFTIHIDQPNP